MSLTPGWSSFSSKSWSWFLLSQIVFNACKMSTRLVHFLLTLSILSSLIFGNSSTGPGTTGTGRGARGSESQSQSQGSRFMSILRMSSNAETLCPQLVADSRTSSTGNFSSPAWPSPYPPNADCFYRLQGVPWEGVKLTFLDFDLEPPYSNAGCLSDYLELTTIDVHDQRTFRGRYCGRFIPDPLLFLDPIVELRFRSNHAVHQSGFFATYEFIDEAYITPPTLNGTSPCGGVVTGIGGVLTSPGYPIGYSAGLDCLWLIRVPYQHAIYLRVQELEFQGSIANCQKAQIGVYDGYEYSLDETSMIKRFCGDLRYYKQEEDRILLSTRNRLLIRYTTTEPSKPASSGSTSVGFRLIWSDVEFNSIKNCTSMSRFPCEESRFCFTKSHVGGAANCPDLRHYCISNQLVCDGIQHCGESDASDEQNCHRAPMIVLMVAVPLTLLLGMLTVCYFCHKVRTQRRLNNNSLAPGQTHTHTQPPRGLSLCCWGSCYWDRKKRKKQSKVRSNASSISSSACFVNHDLLFPPFHVDMAPIAKGGGGTQFSKHQPPGSPCASDIVSPASGFSDTESEAGSAFSYGPPGTYNFSCPTHGPFRFLLPPNVPPLPVLEEYDYEYYDEDDNFNVDELQSDTNTCGEGDEEGGSTISSQNSDNHNQSHNGQNIMCRGGGRGPGQPLGPQQQRQRFDATRISSPSDAMRMGPPSGWQSRSQNNLARVGFAGPRPSYMNRGRGFLQRSDAIWSDNDGKSSIGSTSPGGNSNMSQTNICPRCNCSVVEESGNKMQKQDSVTSTQSQQEQQWRKSREQSGGMSGRLVGVPSLVRQRSEPPMSCTKPPASHHHQHQHQMNRGNQADSGIETSIENVKVVSFDSNSADDSNNSNYGGGGGGSGVIWKQSSSSTTTTGDGPGSSVDTEKFINTSSKATDV